MLYTSLTSFAQENAADLHFVGRVP